MKYAMLISEPADDWGNPSQSESEFDALVGWWAALRDSGRMVVSARLAPPAETTTVSWLDRAPVVTDGPYIEAKEAVAGVLILDVDSPAEALGITRSWPKKTGTRIELRRILEA